MLRLERTRENFKTIKFSEIFIKFLQVSLIFWASTQTCLKPSDIGYYGTLISMRNIKKVNELSKRYFGLLWISAQVSYHTRIDCRRRAVHSSDT